MADNVAEQRLLAWEEKERAGLLLEIFEGESSEAGL